MRLNELTSAEKNRLSPLERFIAAFFAVAAGVGAWQLLFNPPKMSQASSSCMSASCVVQVSSTDQTAVVALIALVAAASLIAILGVRFTKLSAAGASLEEATVSEVDPKKATERTAGALVDAPPEPINSPASPPSDDEWNKLPGWAQNALISWAENVEAATQPMRYAVIDAAKEQGQGSHPWYVKVKLDDGTIRTLRIATGRGGTTTQDADA